MSQKKQFKEENAENQCQKLLNLTEGFKLFTSIEEDAYARIQENGYLKIVPIKSEKFRKILLAKYFEKFGSLPDNKSIDKVIAIMSYFAESNVQEPVFNRVALAAGKIFINLADDEFRYVEITKAGWTVKYDSSPVNFLRPGQIKPLPIPQRNGDIQQLRKYVNLATENDFILFVSFLVGVLYPGRQYPIAIFQGPQGSGKSTITRIIKDLVDPGNPVLRSLPTNEEDIFIAGKNSHLICFDNLSGITSKISDALCRVSTGAATSGRKLYSNDEECFIEVCRPTVINGIDDLTERLDLADRALVFNLPKVGETDRKQSAKMYDEFEVEKAGIFGSLLDALVVVLKERESIILPRKPRMVDFCVTACAGLQAFGYTPDQILNAFMENRRDVAAEAIAMNSVGNVVRAFMADRNFWSGTITQLMDDLRSNSLFFEMGQSCRSNVFSKELNRITPALLLDGIEVEKIQRNKLRRGIKITKVSVGPSSSPNSVSMVGDGDDHDAKFTSLK